MLAGWITAASVTVTAIVLPQRGATEAIRQTRKTAEQKGAMYENLRVPAGHVEDVALPDKDGPEER